MARPRSDVSTEQRAWLQGLVALAAAAAVAAASLAPPPSKVSTTGTVFYGVPHADLLLHFAGYLVLTYLAADALERSLCAERRGCVEAGVLVVVAFGLAVEALQTGVPGRGFSTLDAVVNAAGAAAGYLLVRLRVRGRRP